MSSLLERARSNRRERSAAPLDETERLKLNVIDLVKKAGDLTKEYGTKSPTFQDPRGDKYVFSVNLEEPGEEPLIAHITYKDCAPTKGFMIMISLDYLDESLRVFDTGEGRIDSNEGWWIRFVNLEDVQAFEELLEVIEDRVVATTPV